MPNLLFRQIAFLLSLALALPSPAFALRALEVHEAGLEELDRSLRSSPLGQSSPFAAGAEEAVISQRAEQAVRELFGSGYSVREYHGQREGRPRVLVTVWKGDHLLGGFRLETGAGGKDLWITDVHPRLPEGRGFGRALFGFVLTVGNRWKGREVHLGGASLGRLPGAFDGLVREWGFELLSGQWLGGEDAESFYQGSYRIPALSETQSAHLRAVAGTAWTQHSVADFAHLEEAVRPALTGDGLPELPDRLRKAETLLRAGAEEEAPFSEIGSIIAAYVEFVMDVKSGVREVGIRMIGPAGKQEIGFMAHEALQEDWPVRISGLLDFIGVDSAKARTWKITLEDFRTPDRGTRFFQVTLKPVSAGAEEIPAQRIVEAIERFRVEPDPAAAARNVGYYLEREGALAFAPVLALLEVEGRLSPYGFAGVVETVQEKKRLLKAVANDPNAAELISERIFVVEAQAGRAEDLYAVARARAMGLLEGTVAQVISHPDPDLLAQLSRILSSFGYRLPEDPTVQEAALTLLQAA